MEIPSVYSLKKFVNERLSAAAEEIFGVFEKTLSAYNQELDRQRRLLDVALKPNVKLQRTALLPPSTCIDDVFLHPEKLNKESTSSIEQENSQSPLIKEEQAELCISHEEEEEQETKPLMFSPAHEERDHSEIQYLLLDPDQTRRAAEKEPYSISDEWVPVGELDSDYSQLNKQYVCTICGKSFKMNADLHLHIKLHKGEKPYSCKFCMKEFAFRSSLSRHLRVHTGEKPYECRLCGKRFNVSTTLRVHYRIHTGEKPYKCKTCEKAFTTCSNLKKHLAVHAKVAKCKRFKSSPDARNVTENHDETVGC